MHSLKADTKVLTAIGIYQLQGERKFLLTMYVGITLMIMFKFRPNVSLLHLIGAYFKINYDFRIPEEKHPVSIVVYLSF